MSFKEFKKKEKIKTWENKLRRLFACENMIEGDLVYLNIQYDVYLNRKKETNVLSFVSGGFVYLMHYVNQLHLIKRFLLALSCGYLVYTKLRSMNRDHFERTIMPYFEKYQIK